MIITKHAGYEAQKKRVCLKYSPVFWGKVFARYFCISNGFCGPGPNAQRNPKFPKIGLTLPDKKVLQNTVSQAALAHLPALGGRTLSLSIFEKIWS